MKIVCLGWGSLIWDSRELKVTGPWFPDGPALPIEFTRISADGRVTVIVDEAAQPIPVLWSLMTVDTIADGVESLRVREGSPGRCIDMVQSGVMENGPVKATVATWIKSKGIDAAVWTGLSFSAVTDRRRPSEAAIIEHLKQLKGKEAMAAREYVCRAPVQIATLYRKRIEEQLGWLPVYGGSQ